MKKRWNEVSGVGADAKSPKLHGRWWKLENSLRGKQVAEEDEERKKELKEAWV
jgi:hypothetical protein